jgi:hypothetical protein
MKSILDEMERNDPAYAGAYKDEPPGRLAHDQEVSAEGEAEKLALLQEERQPQQ